MPIRDPNVIKRAAVATTAAVSVLAGATACASSGSPTAAMASAVSPAVVIPTAAATRSAPATPPRLALAQARTTYSTLSGPFNAAVATLNQDAKSGTTWSKFKADLLAAVATNQTWARQVRAVRWPLQVQSLIDSMLKSEIPAEITCDQTMAAAGSLQGAANVFNDDATCKDSPATADKVRQILNLSPTIG